MGMRFDKIAYVKGNTKLTAYDSILQNKASLNIGAEPIASFHTALQKFAVLAWLEPINKEEIREIHINGITIKYKDNAPSGVKASVTAYRVGDGDGNPLKQPHKFNTNMYWFQGEQSELFDEYNFDKLLEDLIDEAVLLLAGNVKTEEDEEEKEKLTVEDAQEKIDEIEQESSVSKSEETKEDLPGHASSTPTEHTKPGMEVIKETPGEIKQESFIDTLPGEQEEYEPETNEEPQVQTEDPAAPPEKSNELDQAEIDAQEEFDRAPMRIAGNS